MNLKICMLLCCISTLNAAPMEMFGQQMNISFNNELLTDVLSQLKTKTGYQFFYQKGVVSPRQRVTVSLENANLEQVLNKVLLENGYAYEVIDDLVVVINKGAAMLPQATESVITGFVTDEENKPLPGVNIVIESDRARGTVTDAMGAFSLRVPNAENARLLFTFIGFSPRTVALKDYRSGNVFRPVQVVMTESETRIGEVVVTGYQTISAERVTGSYAIVKGDELTRHYGSSIVSALEGKVAGVRNSGGDLVIRGTSTFNAERSPLYVIDGFPVEGDPSSTTFVSRNPQTGLPTVNFSPPGINPQDIESITILKDAAAASIYGARASNGVIVITTKKAKKGTVSANFTADFNVTPVYDENKKNRYMSANDYITMQQEFVDGNPNFNTTAQITSWRARNKANPTLDLMLQVKEGTLTEAQAKTQIDKYRSDGVPIMKDLQNELYQPVQSQRYMLSTGKATDVVNTMMSVTYNRNTGSTKDIKGQNLNVSLRNSIDVWKWLNIEANLGIYASKDESSATYGSYRSGYDAPYTRIVDEAGNPIALPFYDPRDYQIAYENNKNDLLSMDLILQDQVDMDIAIAKSLRSRGSLRLNFNITDWLGFSSGVQYDGNRDEVSTIYNKESFSMRREYNLFTYRSGTTVINRLPYGDSHAQRKMTGDSYTVRNQVNFNYTTPDERHAIVAIAGSEVRQTKGHQLNTRVYGYDPETLTQPIMNQTDLTTNRNSFFGSAIMSTESFYSENEILNRFVSWYGNAAYTFNERYDATASIRWDLSDLFGQNAKYLYKPLWSVGAGWKITGESFMEDIHWINFLKLRMTYGINGNVAKDVSPYLIAKYSINATTASSSASIATPPNASLRWERTAVFNTGVDFTVLNNRLRGSIEYYTRNSTDLLSAEDIDPTYGFTSQMLNVGEMTNKGVELTLNGTILSTKDIRWTAGVTFAYNKNRVTKYSGTPKQASDLFYGLSPVEGKPLSAYYSYKFVQINDVGNVVILNEKDEEVTITAVNDVNALVYSGTTTPRYNGGINTAFSYKGLELAANFIYNTGHVTRKPNVNIHVGGNTGPGSLMSDLYLKAWKEPGDENKPGVIPRITYYYEPSANIGSRDTHWRMSDVQIINASYIKLRNLSLRYTFDQKLLREIGIKGLTLRAQANNLFSIKSSKEAYEPESQNYIATPSYSFGLNISL